MRRERLLLLSLLGLALLFCLLYIYYGLRPEDWNFSFPRRQKIILAIIVVALCTGLSSVVFQTITANHILTPSIMGLDSLYLFLQTGIVYFLGSGELAMMRDVPSFLYTLALMVGSSVLLFLCMFRGEERNVYFIVLVGFIFGSVFGGLSNFLQVLIDPSEFSILEGRIFASFNKVNVNLLNVAGIIAVLVSVLTALDFRSLDVLTLGRNHAINLGVNYRQIVLRNLIYISILTSVATVLVGPITFLGILVVSIGRFLCDSFRHRFLTLTTILVSVVILSLGMLVTERLLLFKAPLSVIINFTGGLYFIFLLLRSKNI